MTNSRKRLKKNKPQNLGGKRGHISGIAIELQHAKNGVGYEDGRPDTGKTPRAWVSPPTVAGSHQSSGLKREAKRLLKKRLDLLCVDTGQQWKERSQSTQGPNKEPTKTIWMVAEKNCPSRGHCKWAVKKTGQKKRSKKLGLSKRRLLYVAAKSPRRGGHLQKKGNVIDASKTQTRGGSDARTRQCKPDRGF